MVETGNALEGDDMKKKTLIVSFLLILIVFGAITTLSYVRAKGDKPLYTAFEEVGFTLDEAVTELAFMLKDEEGDYYGYDAPKLSVACAEALGLVEPLNYDFIESSNGMTCTIKKEARDVTTEITVNEYREKHSYVTVRFYVKNKFYDVGALVEHGKNSLDFLNSEVTSSTTYIGYYPGNILKQSESILKDIEKFMEMKVHWALHSEKFFNAYGYTPYIEDYVLMPKRNKGFFSNKAKKDKVNLDMALTYNELKDRTQLYLGTNIINIEY